MKKLKWLSLSAVAAMIMCILTTCALADQVSASHVTDLSQDPGFTGYESPNSTKDWVKGDDGYYVLDNSLAKYVIGTSCTFKKGASSDYSPAATGNNAQGSMKRGTVCDAAPMAKPVESLDWTQFVLRTGKVQKSWWYANMLLDFPQITVNSDGSITASGSWDNNAKVTSSVTYTLIENTPLLKMEIHLHNGTTAKQWVNLGFLFDSETSQEQSTYVPGTLSWRNGDWTNPDYGKDPNVQNATQTPTTGWNDNFIMMGRETGYSGKPVHAVIWNPQNTVYSVIPKSDYTGVWIPATMEAGKDKSITLYYITCIPGPDGEAYAPVKLWADAVEQGNLEGYRTVTGHVTNAADGTPASSCLVQLTGNGKTYSGMTDSDGLYQIYAAKDVTYIGTVSGQGIATSSKKGIRLDDHITLDFTVKHGVADDELPTDAAASVQTLTLKPDYSDLFAPGNVEIANDQIKCLVDTTKGTLTAAVTSQCSANSIASSELVLQGNADGNASHPGSGFSITSSSSGVGEVTMVGTSQKNSDVSAEISYSIVKNSPLIKVKIRLHNGGTSKFTGSLGYLFTPKKNGLQTYAAGGWIGGGAGDNGASLKKPSDENFIYSGDFGRWNDNTAHAVIWNKNSTPEQLVSNGSHTGTWHGVSLAPGADTEIVLYHLPQQQGEKDHPLSQTIFWAQVAATLSDPDDTGRITGKVEYDGNPSAHVTVSGENYYSGTDKAGNYTIYADLGETVTLTASNTLKSTQPAKTVVKGSSNLCNFTLPSDASTAFAALTYGNPDYVYNAGSGLRDWWPTTPYYYLQNDFTALSIYTKRTGKAIADRPSANPSVWSGDNSGNGKWGALNAGTIADAVSRQNNTENLDWSSFVLFPKRPAPGSHDYYDRNYLGSAPEDEEEPNEMYMEWSWWFPVNKLEMPNITTDGHSITASGKWEGGVDKRQDITSQVKYTLVESTPLVRMDLTLSNTGTQPFSGQLAFVLDPDAEGEQHSYVPGIGWEYSQVKSPKTTGWTENYIFDGLSGFSGNTAHAIIWPDNQQPVMISSEAGWINAWFGVDIPAKGNKQLTIYYLPHTPGNPEEPYSVASYWAGVVKNGTENNQAAVTGTITDRFGQPLSGVQVSLTGSGKMNVTTDEHGKYTLFTSAGNCTLTANLDGYAEYTENMTLKTGENRKENIAMQQYVALNVLLPEKISKGQVFHFTLSVENCYSRSLDDVQISFNLPETFEILSDVIPPMSLKPGERKLLNIEAVALAGGREVMDVTAHNSQFSVSFPFASDVSGDGYYFGDNHTHSNYSDGVDTIAANGAHAYSSMNSGWLWSTEHNNDAQKPDTEKVTAGSNGKFVSISGTEITTGYVYNPKTPSGEKRGHALVYGYKGVPRLVITEKGGAYDWQASIDDVTKTGAKYYLAHPYDETYPFENAEDWTGYTGIEVWNGSVHASHPNSIKAFALWDRKNMLGEKKYLATAGTDGHTSRKVGGLGMCGHLSSLTPENVLNLLATGESYGTNGPDLRFTVGGGEMGSTVEIASGKARESSNVKIAYEAKTDYGTLTEIRILAFPITGNEADYDIGDHVIFKKSVSGEKYVSGTFTYDVSQPMFFRMEVSATEPMPGSITGGGPEAGTGFAFSNPVWVSFADVDSQRTISEITYNGFPVDVEHPRFAVNMISVPGKLDAALLKIDAGNATADIDVKEIPGYDNLSLLDVTISSRSGVTKKTYLVKSTDETILSITSQPENQTAQEGTNATFQLTAVGDGLKYQWLVNRNDGRGYVEIAGASESHCTTSPTTFGCNGFTYICRVMDGKGRSVESNPARLTVIKTPEIPATGDKSNIPLWSVVCLAALSCLIMLFRKKSAHR